MSSLPVLMNEMVEKQFINIKYLEIKLRDAVF